jgi:hypothetical protein
MEIGWFIRTIHLLQSCISLTLQTLVRGKRFNDFWKFSKTFSKYLMISEKKSFKLASNITEFIVLDVHSEGVIRSILAQ